jgi:predicted dehydrogenase
METVKIGIIGAGQAGQRIATALNNLDDVSVTAIVDPKNGKEVLTSPTSKWKLEKTEFYDDDDKMLSSHDYDGIVIAADPISVYRQKRSVIARNGVKKPILWERPFGYEAGHPQEIIDDSQTSDHSVISFGRFGVPSKIFSTTREISTIGEIIDFEIFATLNCGLVLKTWRHLGDDGVQQPIHFLDTAFELVESIGLGSIIEVIGNSTVKDKGNYKYDEKWDIAVKTESGVTGRVIGIQYPGEFEYLYPTRYLRVIGSKGAFVSSLGKTNFIDNKGNATPVSIKELYTDERIHSSAEKLVEFFREVDNYPSSAPCLGEALALVENLQKWIDYIQTGKQEIKSLLSTSLDGERYLQIANAVLKSKEQAAWISIC